MALLAYRKAPLANGYSPAELLMGRQLHSTVPAHADTLKLSIPDALYLRAKESIQRGYQKTTFDTRHRALERPPLETGAQVWIKDAKRNGVVTGQAQTPISYHVRTYVNRSFAATDVLWLKLHEPSISIHVQFCTGLPRTSY